MSTADLKPMSKPPKLGNAGKVNLKSDTKTKGGVGKSNKKSC